jgi:hypothetical protein
LNPYYWSGSVKVEVALPEFRFGDRFVIDNGKPDERWTFYIEGISPLSYRYSTSANTGPIHSTNFLLSRGFRGTDKDQIDAIQAAKARYETIVFK